MPKRPFSQKAANHFLHDALHGPPDDQAAAALGRGWRATADAYFSLTPGQQKALDAITPKDSQLIQSTLDTALARRRTPHPPAVVVHFEKGHPDQTLPVEVRVEKGRIVNGAFQAIGAAELSQDQVNAFNLGFFVAMAIVACTELLDR